ncbi:MAG: hypothetical protein ABJA78_00740 [Ferruginibacter sp.]
MRISSNLLFISLMLTACTGSNSPAQAQNKISQFERAGLCDLLIDRSGVYHAVFQESPANGKPLFIYYASSSNKGASWSKPVTISNDNTGNGASYPRILQDASGKIYAIWKRWGKSTSQYPVTETILDGPGGYSFGTLYYKVMNGGAWSNAVQLNEVEGVQESWFATLSPQGNVCVFFTQLSAAGIAANANSWKYCDYMRRTELNGTSHSAYTDMSTPSKPTYAGGYPAEQKGGINLNGYIDNAGNPHLIYEDNPDGVQQIKYYDGKTQRVVYTYPKYGEGNTFHNPAHLLVDEKGADHLVFVPASAMLESEQVWDMNLSTNQTNVLVSIQKKGVKISGFQATQGPKGAMAVTFEAGAMSANTEAFGSFYSNGNWKNVGLTKNAAQEKFFSKEFTGLGGYRTSISTLTRYNSTYGSVAYDAAGHKSMLMTIDAYWTAGGYSVSSPSLVFIPID